MTQYDNDGDDEAAECVYDNEDDNDEDDDNDNDGDDNYDGDGDDHDHDDVNDDDYDGVLLHQNYDEFRDIYGCITDQPTYRVACPQLKERERERERERHPDQDWYQNHLWAFAPQKLKSLSVVFINKN